MRMIASASSRLTSIRPPPRVAQPRPSAVTSSELRPILRFPRRGILQPRDVIVPAKHNTDNPGSRALWPPGTPAGLRDCDWVAAEEEAIPAPPERLWVHGQSEPEGSLAPTSIIWGTADGIVSSAYAHDLAQRIAKARIELIDDAGQCRISSNQTEQRSSSPPSARLDCISAQRRSAVVAVLPRKNSGENPPLPQKPSFFVLRSSKITARNSRANSERTA